MISNTCKIGIKAVIYLASKQKSEDKAGVKEIAELINASEHTLGKILQALVKQNVINSSKGPTGGFYIDKVQLHQPIINIVDAIDGKQVFKACGLGLSKCSETHPCPIHDDYKKGRMIIEKLFCEKQILDLCGPVQDGLAYLIG